MQPLFTQYKDKVSQLQQLSAQLSARETLLKQLRACLPLALQDALVSASTSEDSLLLITTNASWATRLRFEANQLLNATNNPNLHKVHIQILAPIMATNKATVQQSQQSLPTDEDLAQLKSLTETLNEQDSLKESMRRLLRIISSSEKNLNQAIHPNQTVS